MSAECPLAHRFNLDYSGLPERYRDGTERYVEHQIRPGHFLSAVLSNDLKGALGYMDDPTGASLLQVFRWLLSEPPATCWGNAAKVDRWVEDRQP